MFGIGFWELIVIFVVALIIFGPEKLPKIASQLGKAYYDFRKTFEEVKFDIENETRDLDKEIQEAKELSMIVDENKDKNEEEEKKDDNSGENKKTEASTQENSKAEAVEDSEEKDGDGRTGEEATEGSGQSG
jgi:sec-independent protein translocase protein TatB